MDEVKSQLCTSENEAFFGSILLEHIKAGKNAAEVSSILQGTNPGQLSDSSGKTLLHFAAEYGNSSFVQHLIDTGADVNAQDSKNQTPLMLAVDAYEYKTVRVLLEAGADIFVADDSGQCALGKALSSKEIITVILRKFLEKITVESLKASKRATSEAFHRDFPLYHFMQLNDVNVTRFLLEAGSPVNAKDPFYSRTALHLAVRCNCLENVQLLLEYGANVNAEDLCGDTPLEYVSYLRHNEIVAGAIIKALINAGAMLIIPHSRKLMLKNILQYGTREIVRNVLQYPIDLHSRVRPCDKTPLHYISYNSEPGILEELRHLDFDVNVVDQQETTMLHNAAQAGNASSVDFLLDRGADIDARNCIGSTPLCAMLQPSGYNFGNDDHRKDYLSCVVILIERGANPHIFTEENNFDSYHHDYNYDNISQKLIMPVFTKLALLEASGRPMEIIMRNRIESTPRLKITFYAAKSQLEEMKQIKIVNSVTLFDFIITAKISKFARNKCFLSNLDDAMKNCSTLPHYHRELQRRFLKFSQLIELRATLLPFINEILTKFCNLSLCHVAEQIIDYLQDEQWREIL